MWFDKGYALVVGVANYAQFRKLPPIVLKDAEDVSGLLTDPLNCGYAKDHVRHLADSEATADGIREGLRWLAEETSEDDTAIIFFSGHGGRVEDALQTANYLIPFDADPKNVKDTAIESAELTSLLQNIPAGRLLVLFDCCHAGGIAEAKYALAPRPEFKAGMDEGFYARLAEGQGRVIIASSRSDEVSWVLPYMQNSLFTHYLLKALRGEGQTRGDGLIRIFDLFDFVSEKVARHDKWQNPVLKAELENNFPIALYLGGKETVNSTAQLTKPVPENYTAEERSSDADQIPVNSSTQSTKPTIENSTAGELPPYANPILESMFVDYQRVVVKKKFGGGFSGGQVFMVRPIKKNGAELPAVVKIGPAALIEQEWHAFDQYIRHHVPNVADVKGKPVYVNLPDDSKSNRWGGLRYPLVGDGVFETKSLREYCRQASAQDMTYVLREPLFRSLGMIWRNKEVVPEFPLYKSYDPVLPVNLMIEPAEPLSDTRLLNPKTIRRKYAAGEYVSLTRFYVTEVDYDNNIVTLNLPPTDDGLPDSYRVRIKSVQNIASYQENQPIPSIMGVIKETRQTLLQKEAQKALGQAVNLEDKHVTLPNGTPLPNPLHALPRTLRESSDMYMAHIHGDLNLENVLVKSNSRQIQLIDFASARKDHVLHDLLCLESGLWLYLVSEELKNARLPAEQVHPLFESLHWAVLQRKPVVPLPGLEKASHILLTIRQAAQHYLVVQDNWAEYYRGLFIYLLAALKFKNLDEEDFAPCPKEVAFWGAATLRGFLDNPSPLMRESDTSAQEQKPSDSSQVADQYEAGRDLIGMKAEIDELDIKNKPQTATAESSEQKSSPTRPQKETPDSGSVAVKHYAKRDVIAPKARIKRLVIRN